MAYQRPTMTISHEPTIQGGGINLTFLRAKVTIYEDQAHILKNYPKILLSSLTKAIKGFLDSLLSPLPIHLMAIMRLIKDLIIQRNHRIT